MPRLTFPLFLLLWISSAIAFADSGTCPMTDRLRIGAFNIEWLGSTLHKNRRLRTAEEVQKISEIILAQQFDVLVLEEINTQINQQQRRAEFSTDNWEQLSRLLHQHGYDYRSGYSGFAQNVVLVWNTERIQLITPVAELPVNDSFDFGDGCKSRNLRKPLAARLRAGNLDFWMIGVHLKSPIPKHNDRGACAAQVRTQQTAELALATRALSIVDSDIVIAGDFNANWEDATLAPLEQRGFSPAYDVQHPPQGSYLATRHPQELPVDLVLASASAQLSLIKNSFGLLIPGTKQERKAFIDMVSDHAPVWSELCITSDKAPLTSGH